MVVEDIIETWRTMIIALLLAVLACLIFISMMRWFAAPFVWASIFGVIGLLIYGIVETYRKYIYLKNNPVERAPPGTNISAYVEQYLIRKVRIEHNRCHRRHLTVFYVLLGDLVVLFDCFNHHSGSYSPGDDLSTPKDRHRHCTY